MDKLRPAIDAIKKHNFWIVLTLTVGILLTFWPMAVAEIEKTYTRNTKEISSEIRKADKVSSRKKFPTRQWTVEMEKEQDNIGVNLRRVAISNFKDQASVQTWPKGLKKNYLEQVLNDGSKVTNKTLEKYWIQLPDQIAQLKKLADTPAGGDGASLRWNPASLARAKQSMMPHEVHEALTMRAAAKAAEEAEGEDKEELKETPTPTEQPPEFKWPGAKLMIQSQHNLWVHEAIVRSIVATNAKPQDKYNLPIRSLEELVIGPAAFEMQSLHRIRRPYSPASSGSVAKKASAASQTAGKYYRVVPIRLRLNMQLTEVSQFLVHLANDSLTNEVVGIHMRHNPNFEIAVIKKNNPRGRLANRGKKNQAPKKTRPVVREEGSIVEISVLAYIALDPNLAARQVALLGEGKKKNQTTDKTQGKNKKKSPKK